MTDIRYTEDHEWVRMDGETAVIGLSQYAQETLGDIVFADLPASGQELAKGEEAVVVESTKAASEIYAPISGRVSEVNSQLEDQPGTINTDPLGTGWLFKMVPADRAELDGLMDADAYARYVEGLD